VDPAIREVTVTQGIDIRLFSPHLPGGIGVVQSLLEQWPHQCIW